MAEEAYPLEVRSADLESDDHAVHQQLKVVAQFHMARTREFAVWACRKVGRLHCTCGRQPQPLPEKGNRDERRDAARAHPGTCGVWQAPIIAAVETEDVQRTAAKRGQDATHKTFRNQACYNAARALNARGAGVQVSRNICFEKACRALWPGDDSVDEYIAKGFSSENVVPFSDSEGGSDAEGAGDEGKALDAEG